VGLENAIATVIFSNWFLFLFAYFTTS
jgi:hypothetical protein